MKVVAIIIGLILSVCVLFVSVPIEQLTEMAQNLNLNIDTDIPNHIWADANPMNYDFKTHDGIPLNR